MDFEPKDRAQRGFLLTTDTCPFSMANTGWESSRLIKVLRITRTTLQVRSGSPLLLLLSSLSLSRSPFPRSEVGRRRLKPLKRLQRLSLSHASKHVLSRVFKAEPAGGLI